MESFIVSRSLAIDESNVADVVADLSRKQLLESLLEHLHAHQKPAFRIAAALDPDLAVEHRERLLADGDLDVVLAAFSQDDSVAECDNRHATRAFLRIYKSPDAKIRARAAALPFLGRLPSAWPRLLDDDDLRVVRAVLSNGELFQQVSRRYILKIATRSDAHAEAVADCWGVFEDSEHIVGKSLDYLVEHPSRKVRLLMAGCYESDIAESALERLAKDPVAAVARQAKATLADKRSE